MTEFISSSEQNQTSDIDLTSLSKEELQAYIDNLQTQLTESQSLINNTPQ